MRTNIVSFGKRPIAGDVGKVYAAGDVNIQDADVNQLNGAGDIRVINSHIRDTKLAGDIYAENSSFDSLRLAGEFCCKGICTVETFVMIGKLEAEYLECKILRNNSKKNITIHNDTDQEINVKFKKPWSINVNKNKPGINVDISLDSWEKDYKINHKNTSFYQGNIKAETFENLCDFNMDFDFHFKNIINIKPMHYNGVIECDKFYNFSIIDIEGINAENIYIHPTRESVVKQIVGSSIRITKYFNMDESFRNVPKSLETTYVRKSDKSACSVMQIECIEGDTILLEHVKADCVSGDTVTIGDNCTVNCVEYKNKIEISPNAIVNEVIHIQ